VDPHHFNAYPDSDPAFHFNAYPDHDQSDENCDHWSVDTQGLHFKPPGLSCERSTTPPRLYIEPLNRLNFVLNADPDPAFHSNADPDPASKNNPDPQPWFVVFHPFTVPCSMTLSRSRSRERDRERDRSFRERDRDRDRDRDRESRERRIKKERR
jgi:hypothetical protein